MTNDSGLVPVEFKCVVLLDPVQTKSAGGIYIPDERKERDQEAQIEATLIAVGPKAFTEPDWGDPQPQPGDRVLIEKYAGDAIRWKPAVENEKKPFRIINDKAILAIIQR